MDVRLNDDQMEITRQARRFCENEAPTDFIRAMYEDERGYTDELWQKMVEMGWTAMCLPEAYDGLDLELIDLALILEEMGRAVLPGPFFATGVLAAELIKTAGNDEQKKERLAGLASGELKGTLALEEPDGGGDPEYVRLTAASEGETYVLHGTKVFVPDAHGADFLVCAARTAEGDGPEHGLTLFVIDLPAAGVAMEAIPAMDGARKLSAVVFDNARVGAEAVLGEVDQGWGPLLKVLQRAWVCLSAECVGAAQKAMETAVDYAKERVQFDQPIGSFQAVKHMCAEMFMEVESARSLMYWAAWAQDHGTEDEAAFAASAVKAHCTEMADKVTGLAIQVLGGTGFTWEHDAHLYLKAGQGERSHPGGSDVPPGTPGSPGGELGPTETYPENASIGRPPWPLVGHAQIIRANS